LFLQFSAMGELCTTPTLATVAVTPLNKYLCIILYTLTCMSPLTF
jgi:hypothetical protein